MPPSVRYGVVYFRQDAGATLSLLSVKGSWSAPIQKVLDSGWKVAAMGYRSSSIQTDRVVGQSLMPVLDSETISGCPSSEGRRRGSIIPVLPEGESFPVQLGK